MIYASLDEIIDSAGEDAKVPTNADRIRAMSDEDLAAYLVYHNPYSTEEFCLKWLRQPVKDGEGDG